MKHIHIVEPYNSLAMQRMSLPLHELSKLYEITTSKEVDIEADVNIHVPWHTLIGLENKGEGKHIAVYTHCNPPDVNVLHDACNRADLVMCMSFAGRNELVQIGVDPKKLRVNYCGADAFSFKRKIIGIVGFPQPNGRKRESLLLDLAWQYDLSPFQFVFVGDGWGEIVSQLTGLGVTAVALQTSDANLQEVYQQIDALLVTGYAEGGPLPLLEAMTVGTPVISPRFGYASDLLDEHYETPEELMDWLNELAEKSIFTHKLVRSWGWADYVREYAVLIGRLLGESVDLHPEFAMSRYTQLLDIIDEVKPKGIVEIGTWKGNRAIQMIQQAAKYHPIGDIYYQGFDLFESQTGEQFRREFSKQGYPIEVVRKRIQATGANIELIEGDTKDTLYKAVIEGAEDVRNAPEFYFVDGGHSEETIVHDAKIVLDALYYPENAVAVFDDYYHYGKPEGVGCNKVIDALDRNEFEVTHLPVVTTSADGRGIGMVKVQRKHANLRLQRWVTSTGSTAWNDGATVSIMSPLSVSNAQSTSNN